MSDLRKGIPLDRVPNVKEKHASGAEDPMTFAHYGFLVRNKHQPKLANDCVE